jgi:hypothetical protein
MKPTTYIALLDPRKSFWRGAYLDERESHNVFVLFERKKEYTLVKPSFVFTMSEFFF